MNTRKLIAEDEEEVLAFLNCKPLENIVAIGMVRANGLESDENRGTFYGFFQDGFIAGVALIGRVTLLIGPREAASAFADIANKKHCTEVRRVVGKEALVKEFDQKYFRDELRRHPSEHLFWVNRSQIDRCEAPPLEPSRPEDFEEVSAAHLDAYAEILGTVPEAADLHDVCERLRQRIDTGKVFITRDPEGLAFKADVVSDSDEGVYLEAIWTRPNLRGNGYAKSVMKSLCHQLLNQHRAVCLFADAQNKRALAFYHDAGFQPLSRVSMVNYRPAD